MLFFPARIKKGTWDYKLTFRDVPGLSVSFNSDPRIKEETFELLGKGLSTSFKDDSEIQKKGLELLLKLFKINITHKEFLPEPSSARRGEVLIRVPLLIELKILLIKTMHLKNISPAELARRMKVKPQEVTRILNLHHKTKLETLEKAHIALGYGLDFRFRNLA